MIMKTAGRGYSMGIYALGGLTILCGIVIVMNPGQWNYVLNLYAEKLVWLLGITLGAKGVEKIGATFGEAQKLKHGNGK